MDKLLHKLSHKFSSDIYINWIFR